MALSIFLGIWSEEKLSRVRVDDLDFDAKVEALMPYVTMELGADASNAVELTFCGHLLQASKPLTSYGVTSGVTIHVTESVVQRQPSKPELPKITESTIQEFVSNYRSFKLSPSFRTTLHRLETSEDLDKVIAAVPGLRSDPIAIAFVSKPDLLSQLEDPKECWAIAEKNPLILSAARYIITEFHKSTVAGASSALQTPPPSGHSYSLDALSDDDEEMEGDGPSSGAITAAQLADALAAASAAPVSRITTEMLQQALTPASNSSRYTSQLRQMRELGLNDEGRNLRALTAAAGDVQAAIDLVFSGALDD
ncbi:ubiquitin-like protein 7 [Euwallacea fornicatus]|uniref:ubiquitin-like protein 7 n=1 Tax=Euwallacea fornicatus TaxID=995702 RepID=UPI00338DD152